MDTPSKMNSEEMFHCIALGGRGGRVSTIIGANKTQSGKAGFHQKKDIKKRHFRRVKLPKYKQLIYGFRRLGPFLFLEFTDFRHLYAVSNEHSFTLSSQGLLVFGDC